MEYVYISMPELALIHTHTCKHTLKRRVMSLSFDSMPRSFGGIFSDMMRSFGSAAKCVYLCTADVNSKSKWSDGQIIIDVTCKDDTLNTVICIAVKFIVMTR